MLRNIGNSAEILCHQQYQYGAHTLSSTLAYMVERLHQHAISVRKRLVKKRDEISQLRTYWLCND